MRTARAVRGRSSPLVAAAAAPAATIVPAADTVAVPAAEQVPTDRDTPELVAVDRPAPVL